MVWRGLFRKLLQNGADWFLSTTITYRLISFHLRRLISTKNAFHTTTHWKAPTHSACQHWGEIFCLFQDTYIVKTLFFKTSLEKIWHVKLATHRKLWIVYCRFVSTKILFSPDAVIKEIVKATSDACATMKLWCTPELAKHFRSTCITRWLHIARLENECYCISVSRRDYLNSESMDKKKVPFDMTGWKTASPKVLCHILFVFVFVCPSDWFGTFMVGLLTLLSFLFFTSCRIYRSNWTGAIAEFSLARYDLKFSCFAQTEKHL